MRVLLFALLALVGACTAEQAPLIPPEIVAEATALRERALQDNLSVDIVESVTTEVGPRRMGTDGDKRVIAWAQAKFEEPAAAEED